MLLDYEGFDRETAWALPGWLPTAISTTISADLAGVFSYGRGASGSNYVGRYLPGGAITGKTWSNFHHRFNGAVAILDLIDGSTVQLAVSQDAAGHVIVKRGGTTVATSTLTLVINATNFFQVGYLPHTSTGTIQVYVNNVLFINFTGNTQQTANASWDNWKAQGYNSGIFDNLVIYDETGAAPNARTPETRIISDLPNGAGGITEFTPSAGSNYQCQDEQPNDGDTSYVSAASATKSDTYACPSNVPAGSIVYAVGVELVARKDDAGTNEIDVLLESGGTVYAKGLTIPLTTSYSRYKAWWETDPATAAAWASATPANAARPGVRRKT